MKPEEQRIAIAKACGWQRHAKDKWIVIPPNSPHSVQPLHTIPDYLTDLNAVNEAERVLTNAQYYIYHEILGRDVVYRDNGKNLTGKAMDGSIASATAAQRAEAFLKTLNLWTTHPTKGPK